MAEAEEASRESEERYKVLVENAGDVICVIDRDGVFLFMNGTAAERLGGRPEDYIGRTFRDVFPKETADRHAAAVRRVVDTGEGLVADSREPLQGELRWYHTSVQPLRDGKGQVGSVLVIARDVTDEKQAQTALQAVHDRLKGLASIVDHGPAVAFRWRVAEDFPVEFVSGNISQFGYTPDEFTSGRVSWLGVTHREDEPRLRNELEHFLAEGVSEFKQQYRVFAKSGEIRWIEDRNQVIRNSNGQVTHVEGVVWDVTDRKEVEEALRRSEEEYRGLFDRVPVGVYRTTPEGRLVQANPALLRMLGYTKLELAPANVIETYVDPDDRRRWKDLVESRGMVRDFEVQLRRADGSVIWARDTTRVVRGDDGRILYYEGSLGDVTERKQALAALADSEEKYRRLFETETDAILVFDGQTRRLLEANASAVRMYGYTREELLSLTHWQITAEPEESERSIEQTLAGDLDHVSIRYHRKKDGTVFPVEISASTFTLGGRKVLCGAIRDITERVRVEAELRRSESMLAESQRIACLGSWDWDITGDVVRWSSEMYRVFGVDEESFTPTFAGFLAMIHPDDLEHVQKAIDRSMQEKVPYSVEHRVFRPDGTERIVYEQGHFFFDPNGRAVRSVGTSLDVTERRLAEQALRQSEAKYRALAENIHDVVYSMDAAGRLTYVSPKAARYGLRPEKMVGRDFQELILPEDRERVLTDFQRSLATGAEFPTELRIRDGEGRIHWLEDHGSLLRDEAGHIMGVAGVLRDITDRKAAEEALRRHDAMLEGVGRVLAHALRARNAQELGEACLDVVQSITDSKIAFIGEVGPDGCLRALALSNPAWAACKMDDRTGHRTPPGDFPVHGIYGRVLADGKAVITNDPPSHPDSVGVPQGHPRLTAFLGVPLVQEGKTVGMIGVANREGGYRAEDQQALETLAPVLVESLARKRAEDALRERSIQLRSLASELTLAEQKERRRLAAVLHDDLAQILTLMKIRLSLLRDGSDASGRLRGIDDIEPLVERANRVARSLMSQLSHPALYDMGFVPAAEWLTEDIGELYGLHVTMEDDGQPKPMTEAVRVLLFHCLREALVNAAKHAKVEQTHVSIGREGAVVRVVITDDGVGFDPLAAGANASGSGFGLFSIRERLEPLGGRAEIHSAVGKGTTVILEAPVEEKGGGQ